MYNQQLETFIIVSENGSFAKAADKLYISPTAVMKQINTLEERLGVSLFLRTNQGLMLTEAGKSILEDAKYLVDYSKKAVIKAKQIDEIHKNQSIRIGTSIMTPAKFLLDIWSDINVYNHNFKIELIPFENNPINAREILKNLGQYIDIVAGLYDNNFLIERGCKVAHLADKPISFTVPLMHPLALKKEITISDLANQQILMIKKDWNSYIDELRDALLKNNVIIEDFEFFNMEAYNKAVKLNLPIIAVEGWDDIHPLLKLVPTNWKYKIPFGIFYSPTPSLKVKQFINIVQKITKTTQII